MKRTILSIVCLCLCALFSAQAQNIRAGQKFWDGYTCCEAGDIEPDGTISFSGSNYDPERGIADGVDVLRLKKTAQPGKYVLVEADLSTPLRCKPGAEVRYIRQNGMNFLAVKNSKGQIVETFVLTPDDVANLYGQQQQMTNDLKGDFNNMCDAMLMNTHMTISLDYEDVRTGAMRLAKVKNPDIITKTNAQLLQSELDFRDGKAEAGYDNPDGLGGDGRGADEIGFDGPIVTLDGGEFLRVTTAEEFVKALSMGQKNILVARNTEINLTSYLDDEEAFSTNDRQWRDEGSITVAENSGHPFIASEEVFDGRQLTLVNFKQLVIRGEGNSRLVAEPRYAFVLRFVNCKQIEIEDLTIGHTTGGYCQGGVIGVTGGSFISILDSDLYGCGTYGFELDGTRNFSCYHSMIHDCTYGIMLVRNTLPARFESCDFFNNREFSLIDSRGSDLKFYNCRFYANDSGARLFDVDRNILLNSCEIYHPSESLGSQNRITSETKDNLFDENPLNPNIKPRNIGPDVDAPVASADSPDAGKAYLEKFYRDIYKVEFNELVRIINRNVTPKARKILTDAYDYDCDDGNCIATWVFFQEGGMDNGAMNYLDIERTAADTYRVTLDFNQYGGIYRYSITIGLAKVGNSFKIDTLGDWKGETISIIGDAETPDDYVKRYLDEMNRLASKHEQSDIRFFYYALMDIDRDGTAEILVRTDENFAAFAVGSGKPQLLVCFDFRGNFVFYEHGLGWQGGCGTGCHMGEYAVVKNSRLATKYSLMDQYDMNGEKIPEDCDYQKDGKNISAKEADRIFEADGPLGKSVESEPNWMETPDGVG